MSVDVSQIRVGAVFKFRAAPRRVVNIVKDRVGVEAQVEWEYADRVKRGGRLTGAQWSPYFRADAIEEIPDPMASVETRRLIDGSVAHCAPTPFTISMTTHCPGKWAFVDLETGMIWSHDGNHFKAMTGDDLALVSKAVSHH